MVPALQIKVLPATPTFSLERIFLLSLEAMKVSTLQLTWLLGVSGQGDTVGMFIGPSTWQVAYAS